jgi:hypothetical protein
MEEVLPRPFALVLMPFAKEWDDTYQLAIKPACEAAGATAERVDEQIFHANILQRIYEQIAVADLVIAEMSGRNPNVFYEAGYAHALGKIVIFLTRDAADIPFDLQQYPHIVYDNGLTKLKRELERRVRRTLESRPTAAPTGQQTFEVRVNSVLLSEGKAADRVIECRSLDFEINVTSSAAVTFRFGLVTPRRFNKAHVAGKPHVAHTVKISDSQRLHYLDDSRELFPGAWTSFHIEPLRRDGLQAGEKVRCAARIFTSAGYFDFAFTANVIGGGS